MEFLLVKLMEECAEVSQRASKQLQFGPDEIETPELGTNAARLKFEVLDLMCSIVLCLENGLMGENGGDTIEENLEGHFEQRMVKIKKFLEYSRKLGCVTDNVQIKGDDIGN